MTDTKSKTQNIPLESLVGFVILKCSGHCSEPLKIPIKIYDQVKDWMREHGSLPSPTRESSTPPGCPIRKGYGGFYVGEGGAFFCDYICEVKLTWD